MYGEAFARLQRFAAALAVAAARGEDAPRAPLGGAAARRRAGAALDRARCCRRGGAFIAGSGVDGLVDANPVDGVRAPKRRASRCRRRLSVDHAVALVAHRDEPATRAWPRATRASSSCSTAAACASASWSASTSSPAAARPAGSTPATRARTSSARAAKRRAVPVGAPALAALAEWLALRGDSPAPARRRSSSAAAARA